jgi:hypothetical protein
MCEAPPTTVGFHECNTSLPVCGGDALQDVRLGGDGRLQRARRSRSRPIGRHRRSLHSSLRSLFPHSFSSADFK